MRAFKRYSRKGFTLVELMIVVAIIGILAALAIYGVRRYLQSAKTSEAKNNMGAIQRGAKGKYEGESTRQELLDEGVTATAVAHDLCASTIPVPNQAAPMPAKKYQPLSSPDNDFETGDEVGGWKCLKFSVTSPIYYRYGYRATRFDGKVVTTGNGAGGNATPQTTTSGGLTDPSATAGSLLIFADGDLDGDSLYSVFGQQGAVDSTSKQLRFGTEIQVLDEFE